VAKVHSEARRFVSRDYDVVLIGHDGHEEVEGTMGEAPNRIALVGSIDDVDRLAVRDPDRGAYLTQTTLAVDEAAAIIAHLRSRYPALVGPRSEDICYATQNRQEAVADVAPDVELMLVVGSQNSSNSMRLAEVATRTGTRAHLVDSCEDIRLAWLEGVTTIGVTAGASAPESKVHEVVAALGALGPIAVDERVRHVESVSFALPLEVRP
jgi:4-hydroxy-3-methylbut-2-enyl diphosphate reductase